MALMWLVGVMEVGIRGDAGIRERGVGASGEFPEISREELYRFFTLTQSDLALIAPGRGRGPVVDLE